MMDAKYEYSAQQGILGAVFTSMVGASPEITVQRDYSIRYATPNSVQWLKVVRRKS